MRCSSFAVGPFAVFVVIGVIAMTPSARAQEAAATPARDTLRVAVMADDARVVAVARGELTSSGFEARACNARAVACIDDESCRARLLSVCNADAIVGIDVRTESDGVWRRTLVVDTQGALALSLDAPAEGNVLVPVIAIETLHALPIPERDDEDDGPRDASAEDDDRLRVGDRLAHSPLFWSGVVLAGLGVAATATAATFAGLAEAERAEPSAPGDARVQAGDRARALWLGTAAGADVALTGAAAACANSDTRNIDPQLHTWCIE